MQPNGFPKPKSEKKIEYSLAAWAFFLIFSLVIFVVFEKLFVILVISDIIFTGYIFRLIQNSK